VKFRLEQTLPLKAVMVAWARVRAKASGVIEAMARVMARGE